jgi:dienelactone hydrolase
MPCVWAIHRSSLILACIVTVVSLMITGTPRPDAAVRQQDSGDPFRVLQPGERPDDRRLGPLRDLDTHCPFVPPTSAEQWRARRSALQRQLRVALGLWPWPHRTPLNPSIHGSIDRDDYVIEKVVIESLPGHFVTGNVYRPKHRPGRLPAVLTPHGHWTSGRFQDVAPDDAQRAIATGAEPFESAARHPIQARAVHLARLGVVTYLFDMVGYADSVQISRAVAHDFSAARPHMETADAWGFFSPQAELRLQTIMGLQAWNAIRALDYLASRDDVDPRRIGVTGESGGGTQTFILGALDDRPAALFPAVMVSTEMQGGCTCENASYLRLGTNNVEIAALAAPRPLGMTAADDWTRHVATDGFPELKQVYALMGAPDHVSLSSFLQFPHNYNGPSRAAMYEWFNRHLRLGWDSVPPERPFVPLTEEEATVWDSKHPKPVGDDAYEHALLKRMSDESVHALTTLTPSDTERYDEWRTVLGAAWSVLLGDALPQQDTVALDVRRTVPLETGTATLGLLRHPRSGASLPTVLLAPQQRSHGILLWIDPDGKASLLDERHQIAPRAQQALAQGFEVLGIDVLEQGEFRQAGGPLAHVPLAHTRSHAGYTFAYNPPMPARRTQDVSIAIRFARERVGVNGRILVMARGPAAAWVAGARALSNGEVDRAWLDVEGFRFGSITRIDDPDFLPGSAKYGDVAALLALSAPHALSVAGVSPADAALIRAVYVAAKAAAQLRIDDARRESDGISWLLR